MNVLTAYGRASSPARVRRQVRPPFRIAAAQLAWHANQAEHDAAIAEAVALAAGEGAELVCLPELTRTRYFAFERRAPDAPQCDPELLPGGPTHSLVTRLATQHHIAVHASVYEAADDDGLGYNTAFVVTPDGSF